MPFNCLDASFRSFEARVLRELTQLGIALLGMKSLGSSREIVTHGAAAVAAALRYAMSLPVATTISGMNSVAVLRQNLAIAQDFKPMTPAEMRALREECKGSAADGRFELYKTAKKYDGDVGREQHGFPSAKELPA